MSLEIGSFGVTASCLHDLDEGDSPRWRERVLSASAAKLHLLLN